MWPSFYGQVLPALPKHLADGYYGDGITRMLRKNRGAHEPQEEVVFDAVIHALPPGSVMIEAGAIEVIILNHI